MRAHSAAAATLMFIAATACHAGPDVARLKDGRAIDGGWISAEAYARFLEGAMFEANGDDANAALAYAAALAEDPNSPGVLARLGAVRCMTDPSNADAEFTRAEYVDPELEDAWLARAECDLRRGNAEAAKSALRAAALSPNDVEASLVVARAFEAAGDLARSAQWLSALALRRPGMEIAERAVEAQATRAGDRERARKAEAARNDIFASLDARPLVNPGEARATKDRDERASIARSSRMIGRRGSRGAQVRAHLGARTSASRRR